MGHRKDGEHGALDASVGLLAPLDRCGYLKLLCVWGRGSIVGDGRQLLLDIAEIAFEAREGVVENVLDGCFVLAHRRGREEPVHLAAQFARIRGGIACGSVVVVIGVRVASIEIDEPCNFIWEASAVWIVKELLGEEGSGGSASPGRVNQFSEGIST